MKYTYGMSAKMRLMFVVGCCNELQIVNEEFFESPLNRWCYPRIMWDGMGCKIHHGQDPPSKPKTVLLFWPKTMDLQSFWGFPYMQVPQDGCFMAFIMEYPI